MDVIIFWILGSIIVGGIGAERDCGFLRGFLISLFLSPIVGLIMVLFCPKKKTLTERLTEAKMLLESKAISEEVYKEMISDITVHGKARPIQHYQEPVYNPFKH